MEKLIGEFPSHLLESLKLNRKPIENIVIRNVVILGMGGSGIGGMIVKSIVSESCAVPIVVVNNYRIPAFVGKETLVIASSYSGNTEETLAAFAIAQEKKAQLVCVTSGGKFGELAKNNNYPVVNLPNGYPAPRACLGFSVKAQLVVLEAFGLIDKRLIDEVGKVSSFLLEKQAAIHQAAKDIAAKTHGKMKVLYSENDFKSVLLRWVQQINENAKELAMYQVIPEMNHNEIVGWESDNQDKVVLYIRNRKDLIRNQKRMDIMRVTVEPHAHAIIEIESLGDTFMEKLFYAIHFGDYYSLEMSKLNGVDVMSIESINHLKGELSKLD